jgi:iron complex transport system substrate-binding protein
MRIKVAARATLLLAFYLTATAASLEPSVAVSDAGIPRRIVSLAPSVTEVLFALGLGDHVVGVTSYCRFPAETARISKIGGYLTPNYEAIAALQPDLAIVLPEHEEVRRHLAALGVPVLRVDHRSIAGILDSLTAIGTRCGATREAQVLRGELQSRLDTVTRIVSGRPHPRVAICLGRSGDSNGFRSMHAAGPGGIYHDLIVRAGGINVIPAGPVLHPQLSAEGLLRLNPDAIVEFASGGGDPEQLKAEWGALGSLDAVRRGRVFVFTQDFLPVPGPRLIRFVQELARALDPDAPWRKR